ncbi:MAG: hypothetical protein LUG60_10370 [Erysipelotrichaceae bacterium]|nr:hypothetical protein [Erysipelotrichaceae bacterium]
MNTSIYITECIIMCLIFGTFVMVMELMDPVSFVSDYPPKIQKQYYEFQHKEAQKEKITKISFIKKIIGLIAFALIFAWMAHIAGVQTFTEALIAIYGYMIVISLFDVLVLDWILFANVKKLRLPGTENMDKEYHQKWFHVKAMFPMIPIFLVGGIVVAGLMIFIW